MAYDKLLVSLGQFGRYQRRVYLLLCLPAISCALHKLAGVFIQAKMKYRCKGDFEYDNATYWDVSSDGAECYSNETTLEKCQNWVYDVSQYESTTVSEWDLQCDRAWLKATSDSLLMVGVMLGSIGFGDLSDRLGRKPIFFVSLVLEVIFGVLVAVAPDVYTFIAARAIVGATTSGVFLVAYVIAMEMVGPKWRMVAGVGFQLFFTTGFILTAGAAYFIRDWRTLQLAITLPGLAWLVYWWFIPESVRWQLAKGRFDEARKTLYTVARTNNKVINESDLNDIFQTSQAELLANKDKPKPSVLELFKHPNLAKKSIVIFFLWFVNSGTYYGLSWNTGNLAGNEYLNFLVSGAVEVPAYTFLLLTLDRWGRRSVLSGAMIVAGLCLLGSSWIPEDLNYLSIALAMGGKLAITSSYGTVYVLTTEQFPTVIRNVGLGAASTFARFGGILAPYVNITSEVWKPLPMIIFGLMALLSGLLSLLLPETLGKKLPDTIDEGENFGRTKWQEGKTREIDRRGSELMEEIRLNEEKT